MSDKSDRIYIPVNQGFAECYRALREHLERSAAQHGGAPTPESPRDGSRDCPDTKKDEPHLLEPLGMILDVEGQRTIADARLEDVHGAVNAMTAEHGPTYVVLESSDHSYAQAAGSRGRFVVESREVYGEGFRHWRAFVPGAGDNAPAVVTFRKKCPHDKHSPRGCPINVLASDVMNLDAVSAALLQFAVDGTRTTRLQWRDVSAEFLQGKDDCDVRDIRPSGRPDGPEA